MLGYTSNVKVNNLFVFVKLKQQNLKTQTGIIIILKIITIIIELIEYPLILL